MPLIREGFSVRLHHEILIAGDKRSLKISTRFPGLLPLTLSVKKRTFTGFELPPNPAISITGNSR
jgi:hypothetical protein